MSSVFYALQFEVSCDRKCRKHDIVYAKMCIEETKENIGKPWIIVYVHIYNILQIDTRIIKHLTAYIHTILGICSDKSIIHWYVQSLFVYVAHIDEYIGMKCWQSWK